MDGMSEGQLAGASEEDLGSKGAVVPMMMMIIIIIIIVIILSFTHGIYTYIPETNCVPRE